MSLSSLGKGRKLLSILCSVSLCCAFSFPIEAFAEQEESDTNATDVTLSSQDSSFVDVESDAELSNAEEVDSTDLNDALSYSSGAAEIASQSESAVVEQDAGSLFAFDVKTSKNSTVARISVPSAAKLISDGVADSIRLSASVSYAGKQTRIVEKSVSLSSLTDGAFEFDFGNYGKFSLQANFYKGQEVVYDAKALTVGVVADEYNIAPVSATLPVTFFSLNLWGENNIRKNGPTIMLMERPGAYDWSKLPSASGNEFGVYGIPYLTEDEVSYQPADFDAASGLFRQRISIMADYVHDLYQLNPESKFSLYCVDYYCGMVNSIIYANKIPASQYSLTILSDGSFTYNEFSSVYNSTNPASQHSDLVARWNSMKQSAYANGSAVSAALDWGDSSKYLWAIVDSEPNAQLWVARKDLIKSPNDSNAFGSQVQANSKLVQVNIGNLLKQNIQSSDEATAQFKALYNFNDAYFKDAKEQGKSAMLFLGTRVTSEVAFSDYARFAMSYYGDEYAYYYKGHPATPTDMYPNKQQQLNTLGITDVDSSVAAELILFFNPDIYLSGYGSSTYASVPNGMAKGMFQMTKSQGLSNPQYANMDYWASQLGDGSSVAIRSLCKNGHSNYLVEFSDSVIAEKGYDIAIWDAIDSTINFYKANASGGYDFVSGSGGVSERTAISEGDYVVKSSLGAESVLDVAAASHDDGSNVQLYSYNGTNAQKWHVSVDEDGLATITSLESGKVLDVAGGSSKSGTNVWQYGSNGTNAQKWRILLNGNGTYRIVSALDDALVLDAANGSSNNGTNIQVWSSNGSNAQSFEFLALDPSFDMEKQASIPDGYYKIRSGANAEFSLDVRDWSNANGGAIQLWKDADGQNQVFKVSKLDSGFYRIESAWSGKSLDLDSGRIIPGGRIQQWESDNGNKNQEWYISEQSGGAYLVQNAATGLALDLKWGEVNNGTDIDAYTPNGTMAQSWLLTQVSNPWSTMDEWAALNKDVLPDGAYIVKSFTGDGLALDVSGASGADGANVQIYSNNFTAAQRWNVTHDEKGYVVFTNAASGKVLDVSGGVLANGSNVQQYSPNGTEAQKWIVLRKGDGKFEIVSALSQSHCLDIAGGSAASGTNVQLYQRNGTNAQLFEFYNRVS